MGVPSKGPDACGSGVGSGAHREDPGLCPLENLFTLSFPSLPVQRGHRGPTWEQTSSGVFSLVPLLLFGGVQVTWSRGSDTVGAVPQLIETNLIKTRCCLQTGHAHVWRERRRDRVKRTRVSRETQRLSSEAQC
jgi:hypothetical protein